MAARTLLQQAVPTTFGFKAAGWLVGAASRRACGSPTSRRRCPAQLGGAAGTLAALGADGLEVLRLFAAELGLREPAVPWHTIRTPVAELAGALGAAAGAAAKIGGDVVLLAQTEVGEVAERERGRILDDAAQAQSRRRGARRSRARGTRARTPRPRSRASSRSTSARSAPGRRSGARSRRRSPRPGAPRLRCAGRWPGSRSTPPRMRANIEPGAARRGGDGSGSPSQRPDDYLGSADAFVDRALALHRG